MTASKGFRLHPDGLYGASIGFIDLARKKGNLALPPVDHTELTTALLAVIVSSAKIKNKEVKIEQVCRGISDYLVIIANTNAAEITPRKIETWASEFVIGLSDIK